MKETTNFKAVTDEDVIKNSYLDKTSLTINGQLSLLEKNYTQFKSQYNKQSVEEI